MRLETPLVSIIVPSFNQGKFLRETLESIFSQDYRPLEVIVSDGGSTDDSVSIIQTFADRPELVWWSEPDRGVVDGVNKGLARARGEILAIQSSDDTYAPRAIRAAVEAFASRPDLALVYGDVEYVDAGSVPTGRTNLAPFDFAEYVGKLQYIPQAAAFFRASAAREVGGWDDSIPYAPDADYWLRLSARFPVQKIDRVLARYRRHGDQRDRRGSRVAADWETCARRLIASGSLSPAERHFARMGIHLTWHHYTPESRWIARTWHLFRAVLANPRSVSSREFPKKELLPGRWPIWRLLSRIKRGLGFKPRTA